MSNEGHTTVDKNVTDVPAHLGERNTLHPYEIVETGGRRIEMRSASSAPSRPYEWMALGICLLFALGIRTWLVMRTHGVIDGDEALVGIQAQHILRGELPIYFYGQPYLGSLQAYLVAGLFALFGPSVWALRAEPILMSLALVWLTWKLAAALADTARLPTYSRSTFVTLAALVAAIPPLYDAIAELRTWGGLIETLVLMLLLLLAALQLIRHWRAGASRRALTLRWAGMGFLVGLGFWIYPLLISAVLATAIWIVGDRVATMGQWVRANARRAAAGDHKRPAHYPLDGLTQHQGNRKGPSTTLHHPLPLHSAPLLHLLPALAAIPAALIGFAPALSWGATHQWQNITYVLGLSGGTSAHRLSTIRSVTRLYVTCVAPRVISGSAPRESPLLATLHMPLFIVGMLCILALAMLVALSFLSDAPALLRIRRLVGLPLLFAACTALIFCVSSVSASGLVSGCDADFAGRYATPLVLALPFFVATVFTMMSMYRREKDEKLTHRVDEEEKQALEEEQPQDDRAPARGAPTMRRPRRSPIKVVSLSMMLQCMLVIFLVAYLGTQVLTYGLTNAATTFQSPFCLEAPANNDPIIAYLQQEHIRYAWAPNLLGYPIVFKTNSSIIIANPLALTNPPLAINRIPAYTAAVEQADRPSLLVFARHDDAHPALLALLDSEQVTYRVARFPSEPGIDVLVVTPLNRTVSPFTSKAFNEFFICSE